jgi:ribosomal protein S18 acetylase RimI-like enzyme
VTVTIRPMRDDEFEAWLPQTRTGYAAGMVEHGGFAADAAQAKAASDLAGLFPGGRPSPDQWVYVVESDGEPVGELWVGERHGDLLAEGSLWVYDVRIDEAHRGRGFGRAAMLLAEDEARRRGFAAIALNVFGANVAARGLYRSLGYAETAVFMAKRLVPGA